VTGSSTGVAADGPVPTPTEELTMGNNNSGAGAAGGGAIYGLGIFGAWVYFWQQADSFWEFVLVFFQGLLWPAWMVYEVFASLNS
jgi:hypothetical protein